MEDEKVSKNRRAKTGGQTRRNYSADFEPKVVPAAVRGEKTLAELASQFDVSSDFALVSAPPEGLDFRALALGKQILKEAAEGNF